MKISNICKATVDFFKRVHTQYGCLASVAAALGSSADIGRDVNLLRKINRAGYVDYIHDEYNVGSIAKSVEIAPREIVTATVSNRNVNAVKVTELEFPGRDNKGRDVSNIIGIKEKVFIQKQSQEPFYRGLYEGNNHRSKR